MKALDIRSGKTVKTNKRFYVGVATRRGGVVHLQALRYRKNPDKEPREVDFTISRSDFYKLVAIAPDQWCGEP